MKKSNKGSDLWRITMDTNPEDCNLKCIMCNREVMTRPQVDLDLGLYKNIVDEAVENRIYSISIYALGEPFLHKDIREGIKTETG